MELQDVFGLDGQIEENAVCYVLYNISQDGLAVDEFQSECISAVSKFTVGYVWQKEGFCLHPSSQISPPWMKQDNSKGLAKNVVNDKFLWGKVKFGDSVDDEWFIVSLLMHLTKSIAGTAVQVWDNDGEFLLIETAFSLPKWIKPDNSTNRVWLFNGKLHLMPKTLPKNGNLEDLTVKDALKALKYEDNTEGRPKMQEALENRLMGLPSHAAKLNLHWARCRVPAKVAHVVSEFPRMVSTAVTSFVGRDKEDMKLLMKMSKFPPKDFVQSMVCFHRGSYAQLIQHNFQAPRGFPMPVLKDCTFKAAELGMKLTCGIEILYNRSMKENEASLGKDDRTAVGRNPTSKAFVSSLDDSGYFKGNIPGSKEHSALLSKAMQYFKDTSTVQPKSQNWAQKVDSVLKDWNLSEDQKDQEVFAEDDDSWMYNGAEHLEGELNKRQAEINAPNLGGLNRDKDSDSDVDPFDPSGLVDSFKGFVDKFSSHEGAELPEEKYGGVNFDGDKFVEELRSVLGLRENAIDEDDSETDASSELLCTESSQGEVNQLESRDLPETPFNEVDAKWEVYTNTDSDDDSVDSGEFLEAYTSTLSSELKSTKMAETFDTSNEIGPDSINTRENHSNHAEDLTPLDVDVNLVKSILASVNGEQGVPGPASAIAGLMSVGVPQTGRGSVN